MATRRSPPKRSGSKSRSTNPQVPSPASSDRFSQLEKQVAESRDGTISDVLEKLRRPSYDIEGINRTIDTFAFVQAKLSMA